MLSAKVTKKFNSVAEAEAAGEAITPETNQKYERGARTRITVKNNVLTVIIDAQNSRALEASRHNYSELVSFVKSIEGV
jgi:tRNA threonylcarbamoyladenosine modification (KEOPS) complex  Pcc1 subunit